MLVCHCMAVYESEVRDEIDRGARDESDIADACEAGTVCGGCVPMIQALVGQCAGRSSSGRGRQLVSVGGRR